MYIMLFARKSISIWIRKIGYKTYSIDPQSSEDIDSVVHFCARASINSSAPHVNFAMIRGVKESTESCVRLNRKGHDTLVFPRPSLNAIIM